MGGDTRIETPRAPGEHREGASVAPGKRYRRHWTRQRLMAPIAPRALVALSTQSWATVNPPPRARRSRSALKRGSPPRTVAKPERRNWVTLTDRRLVVDYA
jgi:hypothetical protein